MTRIEKIIKGAKAKKLYDFMVFNDGTHKIYMGCDECSHRNECDWYRVLQSGDDEYEISDIKVDERICGEEYRRWLLEEVR